MSVNKLSLESLAAGFYVNITRSLAPVFLAAIGYSIYDILWLNLQAYAAATLLAYVLFKIRRILLNNLKKVLLTSHVLERVFWGLIPISHVLGFLPLCYSLAVMTTVPTSSLLNIAIYSLEGEEVKKTLYYRSSFGSFSNFVGSITAFLVVASMEGTAKYFYLYAIAAAFGMISSLLVSMTEFAVKHGEEMGEEERIKSVNVFLFLLFLSSASALIGAVWQPYVMKSLKAADYIAVAISTAQTITTIFSPFFWAKRSYRSFRIAIVLAATSPLLIAATKIPELHVAIAVLYAFSMNGSSMLASFLFAELSKSREVVAFFLSFASSLSQLTGVAVAIFAGSLMFVASAFLFAFSLLISILAIPEVAYDVEKARIYSRIFYGISLSAYTFSITLTTETALLAVRLAVLFTVFLLLTFLYRVSYYLIHGSA
ncbi:conserved hypothetical protein [Ferroglobus placidus DSM 10642]|uniref:Major facilitator superfamily MFS_1 n=1 Tax=Ferroglobus placidus (strain DSM 10642 / AEDII12DO) TaxID=589924 RepID=D3S0C6_FERPA|nr:hypothetical protein [Ferroglobus placidus]ADC66189.1 conserved hypothetical protein [Ferroglobus placidus DSM 10642]